MKCYKCNGTGYYDIDNECPVCDGTGEYEPFDADVELDKLYPTEQTNEKYLKSCTTEQLAEWLNKHSEFIYSCGKNHFPPKIMNKNEWKMWLKQLHTNEER